MLPDRVLIEKGGKLLHVGIGELSKGDTVLLQTGDIVPADLQLTEVQGLEIDEFDITGSILPVVKGMNEHGDRSAFMGARVLKGAGKGIVVAAGGQTEYGRIAQQHERNIQLKKIRIYQEKYLQLILILVPAFCIQMFLSANRLSVLIVFLVGSLLLLIAQNDWLIKSILISAENRYLSKRGIKIRNPGFLDQVSDVKVVCFDKTGVLTARQVELSRIYWGDERFDASGLTPKIPKSEFDLLIKACALTHDIFFLEKIDQAHPVDKAILRFVQNNNIHPQDLLNQNKRIYDQPFDPEVRHMVCGYTTESGNNLFLTKGDPTVIFQMCGSYRTVQGDIHRISFEDWLHVKSNLDRITQDGNSALALAYSTGDSDDPPDQFTFLCLLEFENALQPGARETVRKIGRYGIRSIMLTGDDPQTALKISAVCGITDGTKSCLTGKVLERMELSEIARQSAFCSVYARLTPSQKGILIRTLQQRSQVTAMVGDGPNDAVALKTADISISFLKDSSPVARGLADVLINHLEDLIWILESGRKIARRTSAMRVIRTMTIVISVLSLYSWTLSVLLA